ncbi:hypothetical protein RhiLY_00166 [Ceratobasidium sp. AG-Ba]|nr:hypothetical protein RhiLY_00166 [Ceratobasidium sp. AG-Ba]
MKEWVDECVVPYANRKCQELGRLPTQKAILILDCWSVHKGEEFLTWMKASHPLIILVFVPAGSSHQVSMCRVSVSGNTAPTSNGIPVSQVKLDTGLGTLRDASAAWLMEAWVWFCDHPQAVRDAWHDTKFGDWDLSYETLTSARSRTLVHERFTEDIPFSLAISSQIPTDPLFVEVDSPKFDDDSALDPNMLVDIRGQLPMDVEEQEGGYIYTGDVA